jgi:4-amino-4-deoxy-L-arabinose transferase-like glycosyltransferase
MWVDEEAYWSWSKRIAAGHGLPDRPFYQDPLFAYGLAGVMRIWGSPDLATLRLLLAVLGSVTPAVVYWAGRIGFGRTEGLLAGLGAALYGPLVFTDSLIEKEGLAAFLTATGLLLIAHSVHQPRPAWSAAAAGCAFGALALVRANALLIGPLGALWWVLAQRSGRMARAMPAVWFLGGFAAAIAPVTLANFAAASPHEVILTTWQGGPNFYIGNGPEATGIFSAPPFVTANPAYEAADYAAEASRRARRPLAPAEVSQFWFAQGLRQWRDAPRASLRLLGRKVLLLFNDYEVADNQGFEVAKLVAVPALSLGFLTFGCLLPFATIGLARPERNAFWWFVALATFAGLGSTAIFFIVGRYRIPWIPGVLLLSACGATDIARFVRGRQWLALVVRVVLLGIPAVWLSWRPMGLDPEERWGHAERMLFIAYLQAGQLDAAIDALDDARAIGPEPAARLGEMLASGPLHDLFLADRDAALRVQNPHASAPEIFLRRARLFRQVPEGRAESRELLEQALKIRRSDARFLRESGAWWLGEVHDPAARSRAVEALDRGAHGENADASAAILLALVKRDRGYLPPASLLQKKRDSGRLRLAHAILADPSFRTRR